jgi:hypothetical protein
MLCTRPLTVLGCSLSLALWVPGTPVLGQNPPPQKPRSTADSLNALAESLDASLQHMQDQIEKDCQRPFIVPSPIPASALDASDQALLPTGTTIRLTATAIIDRRPVVDPGSSLFPPPRCTPHIPLQLVLYLRPVEPSGRLSKVVIDSVWIRLGTHRYAVVPALTAVDAADTDTLITRRVQGGPLWITGPIDVFLRLAAPSHFWVAVRHLPIRTMR